MSEVFRLYSQYTGTGIIMVLFFTSLVYLVLKEKDKSIRTIIVFGSIVMTVLIFMPPVFYLYDKYVDGVTYWRMWWMIPTGIGMAYVGANMIEQHKAGGLLLVFIIILLGGEFVYSGHVTKVEPAENPYQIPQLVIDIADYIDEQEENETIYAAFPPELLIYIRQYNIHFQMPYGREMLDNTWGGNSDFYNAMADGTLDFEILMDRCQWERVRYIVVDDNKAFANAPEDYYFQKLTMIGKYAVYEYTAVDWPAYFEKINNY